MEDESLTLRRLVSYPHILNKLGIQNLTILLLKLCNITYAIRSQFLLFILSLRKATSDSFPLEWQNENWIWASLFLLFSLLIKMIHWWCLFFSIAANTGFMQRFMFNRVFSLGILRFWSFTVISLENSDWIYFQNSLLSVISFGSKFEKYFF